MDEATSVAPAPRETDHGTSGPHDLAHIIEHAAHFLPSQGPIQVFIHHNTLHAFEHLPFHEAVKQGGATYGCNPYLPEDRYRDKVSRGRILFEDLAAVLIEDLGEEGDRLLGFLGTRYHLRLAMLQHPLRLGPDAELRWLIAETEALKQFRSETPFQVREQMIERTRRWVMRDLRTGPGADGHHIRETLASLFERFGESQIERWSPQTWEAFTLHALWRICHRGVHAVQRFVATAPPLVRHRDLLLSATGMDTDRMVHEVLIRFCAAFLDQGVASWPLPGRESGFLQSFIAVYKNSQQVRGWLRPLSAELQRIDECRLSAIDVIDETLRRLGVPAAETDEYLTRTLLAMRGWAGMLWQMETNAEWAVQPAPRGTLVEYVAVRLLLLRLAIEYVARTQLGESGDLTELRSRLRRKTTPAGRVTVEQRTFLVFQLAQILGWNPDELNQLSKNEWMQLVDEVESFSSLERRRIYHLAFERRYRNQTLDAFVAHAKYTRPPDQAPNFQICCCLDEREESFRRHLEEIDPCCETLSFAGFFAVAMYYRGTVDAHYVPLCPVVIKPQHYVREEVVYSLEQSHRMRTETRRALGKASHRIHVGSRSGLAGALASILGSLASIPLVARVLFPRLTSQIRRAAGSFVQPPPVTRLILERTDPTPGPENGHLGYTLAEMINIVERVLRDIGVISGFSRLVIIMGHGSSSLNNPHESAHDCGACGGGRGGPNARAYAHMANDPRIRTALAERGLVIPSQTIFVGGIHNTCDDSVGYYDLDRLPTSHRADFE
ncbi:MAG TPA: putative inorganic carbon transporter subunit DabA, partial [Pirellulaceae bacterium]|nr:putative inorganic carbon transporter subunit DabA [Pirellulaceae bacterium]